MRILVVEDEVDLRQALVQALQEAGYAVDSAADGNDGLTKASTWPYDLIVLDIMLPQRDGWSVLEELRKQKATPVLILSAKGLLADRLHGLDGGADDYLVKPFAMMELLARVRALIRRSMGQANGVVNVGDIQVDMNRKTVCQGECSIELTAREFSLVELLVLNLGRVVSRTEIYDHLFGDDDDTLSNLVDVHVSNIRKKLGTQFIQTRRGQGYLVED
ncbi:MAG: response regulator transcription factor [Pirellulaceae bacterium]